MHRDASGRIVDVEKLKEEARVRELEEKRKAKEREEWSKGFVQRRQREDRAQEEHEMGRRDVARCVLVMTLPPPADLAGTLMMPV